MRVWMLVLAVLVLCDVKMGFAETWTVGLRADHRPYSYKGTDGIPAGVDVELISAVFRRMEVEPDFRLLGDKERLNAFRSRSIDMLGQVRGVPSRFDDWAMIGPLRTHRVIVVGGPFGMPDWTQLSDFKGKIIAGVTSQYHGPLYALADEFETVTFHDLKTALDKVGYTVNYVIGEEIALVDAARTSDAAGELRFLEKPFDVMPLYAAFPKSLSSLSFDSKDVPKVERFHVALDASLNDGTIEKILARWRDRQGLSIPGDR